MEKRKSQQDQVVVKDPITGKELHTPKEIKAASLDYLTNLLKTKEPQGKYIDIVRNKKKLLTLKYKAQPQDVLFFLFSFSF